MCPTVNLFFNLHSHFKVLIGVLQRARERTLHEGCHGLAVLSVSRSVVSDSGTPQTAARQAPLPLTISQSLLKRMSIESVMPCNHLSSAAHFASCPQSLPARGSFSSELALSIRWPLFLLSRGQAITHSSLLSKSPVACLPLTRGVL